MYIRNFTDDRVLAAHIPIQYAGKSGTEREARYVLMEWSAQRDKHGAIKLKPSVARFQLVIQYSALVVRSGYTGNVVVLRVACTKW